MRTFKWNVRSAIRNGAMPDYDTLELWSLQRATDQAMQNGSENPFPGLPRLSTGPVHECFGYEFVSASMQSEDVGSLEDSSADREAYEEFCLQQENGVGF